MSRIFAAAGLRIWNVEELPTHGGSLRVYGCHADDPRDTQQSVDALLQEEADRGLQQLQTYLEFQPRADKIKNDLLAFLIEQKRQGKTVAAYGAAAKAIHLLNYAGVKPDLLAVRVRCRERPSRGNSCPGATSPFCLRNELAEVKPDFVLILPWNIAEEVKMQNAEVVKSGTRFVTAVPELSIQ